VAAHVGHPVLWERLKKDFARFETERIPKDKSVEVCWQMIGLTSGRTGTSYLLPVEVRLRLRS
jgi:hypothetical protein